jgi:hypothetical protein
MKPRVVEVAAGAVVPNPPNAAVEVAGAPKPVMRMTKLKMRYRQKKAVYSFNSSEIITTKT